MRKLSVGDAEQALLAKLLRKVDFFEPLTVGEIDEVLPHVLRYAYDPGAVVFQQGTEGDAFFVVHSGSVDVEVRSGFLGMSKKKIAQLGPGEFFGETALISRKPRNATIICAEPTELFVLLASDFKRVISGNPRAVEQMSRVAERRRFDSAHS